VSLTTNPQLSSLSLPLSETDVIIIFSEITGMIVIGRDANQFFPWTQLNRIPPLLEPAEGKGPVFQKAGYVT
jgi:hypothetical protein